MRRMFLKRSLRRSAGQFVIVGLLVAIASAMLHLAAVLILQYPATLDDATAKLNTEHIFILLENEKGARDAERIAREDGRVKDHILLQTLRAGATFEYDGKEQISAVTIVEQDKDTRIGRSGVVAEDSKRHADPIWLPYSFKTAGGYKLGDPFAITVGEVKHRYHIQGFHQNPVSGVLGSIQVEFRVKASEAAALASAPGMNRVWQLRALVKDVSQADDVAAEISSKVTKAAVQSGTASPVLVSVGWKLLSSVLMIPANVLIFSFILFAAIVASVVAVIVRFAIRSVIVREMPALGTQKALGFRSGHIARLLALPFAIVALAASLAGAAVGVVGVGAAAGAMLAVVGVTALAVARKVRRIPPVEALRGGEATHSFHSNHLPLRKARGPLTLVLGVKSALQARAQTIMVAIVIAMVAFASVFSVALYSALFKDSRKVVGIFIGDRQDVTVSVLKGRSVEAVRKDLGAMPGVERVQIFDNTRNADVSGRTVSLSVADSYPSSKGSRSVYKGRYPKSANEISLGGKFAKSLGVDVGDEVTVDFQGGKATYLVTGLTQTVVRMGMVASVTIDGAKRMNAAYQPKYATAVLKEGQNIDAFVGKVRTEMKGRYDYVVNSYAISESYVAPYLAMSKTMSFAIFGVAGLVTMLVIGLVVGSAMVRSRRTFGVLKAAGFTNAQLMRQMLACYLPPVAIGGAIGIAIGSVTAIPLFEGLLRSLGVERLDAEMPVLMVAGLGMALLVITALLVMVLARETRTVTSRELLTE